MMWFFNLFRYYLHFMFQYLYFKRFKKIYNNILEINPRGVIFENKIMLNFYTKFLGYRTQRTKRDPISVSRSQITQGCCNEFSSSILHDHSKFSFINFIGTINTIYTKRKPGWYTEYSIKNLSSNKPCMLLVAILFLNIYIYFQL